MERLLFQRRKYGKELLIDACDETELEIIADTLVLNFYTIIFMEKASGIYLLDTEKIHLHDQLALFVKPGQINGVGQAMFEKCHLLFFEGDFLDEFFSDKHFIFKFGYFHHPGLPSYLQLDPADFRKYNALAKEIREEIQQQSFDSEHILRALIYYLMVRLHQAYADQYGASGKTLADPRILHFLKLLQTDIKEQHTVEGFAGKLGVSRVHLNTLCKQYFAKTASQVIREQLLAEIKKEISYTDKDLAEIAYTFNFSAPSHFSRFVKQMTGLSPQAFRDVLSNW